MPSIFSRIAAGEIPCHRIAEDERFLAFLDINPLNEGHTLVIPKAETDYVFDLDDQTLADLHVFAKKVARAIEKAVPCKRVGVAVVGFDVPHVHVHLIPLLQASDLEFSRSRTKPSPEQLAETATRIRQAF